MAKAELLEDTKTFANVLKKQEARKVKEANNPDSIGSKFIKTDNPNVIIEDVSEKAPVESKKEEPKKDILTQDNKVKLEETPVEINIDSKKEVKAEEAKTTEPVAGEKTTKFWWEEDTDGPDSKDKKGSKEQSVDYETKIKEYESILKDPEIEAFLAAKKAGKSLIDFANEIKGVDVDKIPTEELYKIRLTKAGAEGEELEAALEEFRSKPKWQQNEETQSIRVSLKAEQESNMKRFTQTAEQYTQRRKQNTEKALADLEGYINDLNEKDYFGVKITPEISSALKDTVINEMSYTNPDGTYNIPLSVETAFWHKFNKLAVKANVAKAKAEATEQALKEISRPSLNNTSDKRLPSETDSTESSKDAYIKQKRAQYHR